MHIKITALLLLLSLVGLSAYFLFSSITNEEYVQGSKIAIVQQGNDTSGVPANGTGGPASNNPAQIYICSDQVYKDASCTVPSTTPPYVYFSTYNASSGCHFIAVSANKAKVTCTLVTDTASACIPAYACQLGGIGCCDGSTPKAASYCSSGKSCPAPSGGTGNCGATCTANSACSTGLSCQDIGGTKRCWNQSLCMGQPEQRIRVQGKVVNCYGQPVQGARVSMFADTTTSILNTSYTDVFGNYRITKSYKDTDGVRRFALMAGKDAKSTEVNYFSRRLAVPMFLSPYSSGLNLIRYGCDVVNCNYRQNQAAGGPYRENYHLGGNWTQAQFKGRVVHGTTTATGFDFKQVNCQ